MRAEIGFACGTDRRAADMLDNPRSEQYSSLGAIPRFPAETEDSSRTSGGDRRQMARCTRGCRPGLQLQRCTDHDVCESIGWRGVPSGLRLSRGRPAALRWMALLW